MPTSIDRKDLERLANLAESLVVRCHQAEREANPTKWDEVLSAFDDLAVHCIRQRVMEGNLKVVAQHLIRPETRVACAMTFLAAVEQYLDAEDVRELRELWKQPAEDKTASLDRLLQRQQDIDRQRDR